MAEQTLALHRGIKDFKTIASFSKIKSSFSRDFVMGLDGRIQNGQRQSTPEGNFNISGEPGSEIHYPATVKDGSQAILCASGDSIGPGTDC
jgi:hypothetical protein